MKPRQKRLYLGLAALAAATFAGGVSPSEAQSAADPAPSRVTLEVEVANAAGERPEDLAVEDLEILLEGRSLDLLSDFQVNAEKPWRLVIYLDHLLTSSSALGRGALALGDQARRLAQLGEVEVISADPEPRRLLPPSRDPAAIEAALSLSSLRAAEQDSVRDLRRRYFQQLSHLRGRPGERGAATDMSAIVQEAIDTESRLVTRQQDFLHSWLAANREAGERRVLLWITEGFDVEPREFYLRQLPSSSADLVKRGTTSGALQAIAAEGGRTVAALGWTSLIFSPEPLEMPSTRPRGSTTAFETVGATVPNEILLGATRPVSRTSGDAFGAEPPNRNRRVRCWWRRRSPWRPLPGTPAASWCASPEPSRQLSTAWAGASP